MRGLELKQSKKTGALYIYIYIYIYKPMHLCKVVKNVFLTRHEIYNINSDHKIVSKIF